MQLQRVDLRSAPAHDVDPLETQEWREAFESAVQAGGSERGRFLLEELTQQARRVGIFPTAAPFSAYRNTISLEQQPIHPGDVALEERVAGILRWNALAMVMRANRVHGDLGGHIASYASAAEIFETGFNHFFRAASENDPGDLVFLQPHSAPGVYARAYLEGRLSESQIAHYRQEVRAKGLSSYPHPWLMPDFWQFPTGSMGIGPLSAVYQARFMRYLEHRGLASTAGRHVWGVFGDGEMDEPESLAGLTLAAREQLDNLTFIVNCNLQRLDGPVRGNGQIIQELEALFTGAGWNVIKVLWGSEWDELFQRDHDNALLRQFSSMVDGQYQTLGANDGAYNREYFFQLDPQLRRLVAHMSVQQIDGLRRGGHDFRKLYAAFAAAREHRGRPSVILAKTKKGYGMGPAGESRNAVHQQKKLEIEDLVALRERLALPLSDDDVAQLRFYRPHDDSPEMRYIRARRAALGGSVPVRNCVPKLLSLPPIERYAQFALDAAGKEMSTTMAFVRILTGLMRDTTLGPRIVPVVADEARTFGMASLFRQFGIYSPLGQTYVPEDAKSLLSYREAKNGQLLEEGINEAGAIASWTAAATAYSVHREPLLPFYIFYSMFGFQRVGDLIWAAADQRARGFLIGATAGRTTLGGEGLQHQDGSSVLVASTVPNCRVYDPAFAGELAVIIDSGAKAMLERHEDVFYYVTAMNESYPHPSLPPDSHEGVIRGMYRYSIHDTSSGSPVVRLLGAGAILREVIAASELLSNDFGVHTEVWSVTSFSELARDAREVQRLRRLNMADNDAQSYVEVCLAGSAPVIAVTDYVRAYPQLIAEYVNAPFVTLGTDGFGRSDTRSLLREFFEVNRFQVVLAALQALGDDVRAASAIERYRIVSSNTHPWRR